MRKDNDLHKQALINVKLEESQGYFPLGYADKHLLDLTDPQEPCPAVWWEPLDKDMESDNPPFESVIKS
jgi:hypothetical protein